MRIKPRVEKTGAYAGDLTQGLRWSEPTVPNQIRFIILALDGKLFVRMSLDS